MKKHMFVCAVAVAVCGECGAAEGAVSDRNPLGLSEDVLASSERMEIAGVIIGSFILSCLLWWLFRLGRWVLRSLKPQKAEAAERRRSVEPWWLAFAVLVINVARNAAVFGRVYSRDPGVVIFEAVLCAAVLYLFWRRQRKADREQAANTQAATAPVGVETPKREIKFACLHCGQHLCVEADCAGMEVECPTCGTAQSVPIPEAVEEKKENVKNKGNATAKAECESQASGGCRKWLDALFPLLGILLYAEVGVKMYQKLSRIETRTSRAATRETLERLKRFGAPPVVVEVASGRSGDVVVRVRNTSRERITATAGLYASGMADVAKGVSGEVKFGGKAFGGNEEFRLRFANGRAPRNGDWGFVKVDGYEQKAVIFEMRNGMWCVGFDNLDFRNRKAELDALRRRLEEPRRSAWQRTTGAADGGGRGSGSGDRKSPKAPSGRDGYRLKGRSKPSWMNL